MQKTHNLAVICLILLFIPIISFAKNQTINPAQTNVIQTTTIRVLPEVDHMEVNTTKNIYSKFYPANANCKVPVYKIIEGEELAQLSCYGGLQLTANDKPGKVVIEISDKINPSVKSARATIYIVEKILSKRNVSCDSAKDVTMLDLDCNYKNQKIVVRNLGSYMGHPNSAISPTGEIFMLYPQGHGSGKIKLATSADNSNSWKQIENTPSDWENSRECPTIYRLNCGINPETQMATEVCYVQISGRPDDVAGFDYSFSKDGINWSGFRQANVGVKQIVALADLIQLKDQKSDEFIDKWLGVFHSKEGQNKLIHLTFRNGIYDIDHLEWKYSDFQKVRDFFTDNASKKIEMQNGLCEVGFLRSPDHREIAMIARNQSHNSNGSFISFSCDEGISWSTPVQTPSVLDGERHQGKYFKDGRLIIAFREAILRDVKNAKGKRDWVCGEFSAWVGTYLDLKQGGVGQYLICLKRDFTPNAYSGDAGYSAIELLEDGSMFIASYGVFDSDGTLSYMQNAFGENSSFGEKIDWSRSAAATPTQKRGWSAYLMSFNYSVEDFDKLAKSELKIENGEVISGRVDFEKSWRKFPKGKSHASPLLTEKCSGDAFCKIHLGASAARQHTLKN